MLEEASRTLKREYVDGQVYALAGAGDRHNRIAGNIFFRVRQAVGTGKCRPYISDMNLRIQTELTERLYYPDMMVTCAEHDTHELYKVAPSLLVEVTLASTQGVDRREKLQAYQRILELRDYLIVSVDEKHVERYRRDDTEGWWLHEYREDGTLELPYLGLDLTLDDIYEGL